MVKLIGFLSLFLSISSSAYAGGVDLHLHLPMEKSLNWAFNGRWDGEIRLHSWRDFASTHSNSEMLNQSQLDIAVVALYANPIFSRSLRESIRKQISLVEDFVGESETWIIARHPAEARAALKKGKKVLVLSLEGASGILETEADLKEFIDEKGIRIVTLMHLTDDDLGGVALLKGRMALSSPISLLTSYFEGTVSNGVLVNSQGLTKKGLALAKKLIQRKVWLDFSHASDRTTAELNRLALEKPFPILYTHTVLRKYHDAERGITRAQLQLVKKTKGIIGLMPVETMLEGTTTGEKSGDCSAGISAFVTQYNEMAEVLPAEQIMIGTDSNSNLPYLSDRCLPPWAQHVFEKGFWNLGQLPTLLNLARKQGAKLPEPITKSTQAFLEAWARLFQ